MCGVPYLPSALLVLAGLLLLVLVGVRLLRALRRFARVRGAVRARMTDRTGLLRARTAALQVAFAQRRARVPSTNRDQPADPAWSGHSSDG